MCAARTRRLSYASAATTATATAWQKPSKSRRSGKARTCLLGKGDEGGPVFDEQVLQDKTRGGGEKGGQPRVELRVGRDELEQRFKDALPDAGQRVAEKRPQARDQLGQRRALRRGAGIVSSLCRTPRVVASSDRDNEKAARTAGWARYWAATPGTAKSEASRRMTLAVEAVRSSRSASAAHSSDNRGTSR